MDADRLAEPDVLWVMVGRVIWWASQPHGPGGEGDGFEPDDTYPSWVCSSREIGPTSHTMPTWDDLWTYAAENDLLIVLPGETRKPWTVCSFSWGNCPSNPGFQHVCRLDSDHDEHVCDECGQTGCACSVPHGTDWHAGDGDRAECPVHVDCDSTCQALRRPRSTDECFNALVHWENHGWLYGCSHGC